MHDAVELEGVAVGCRDLHRLAEEAEDLPLAGHRVRRSGHERGHDRAEGERLRLQPPRAAHPDDTGQVFGLAGVNRVRGTWRLDGPTLTFGPVVSTLMAGPPDAMTRERQVLRLLGEPVRVSAPDGDTLELDGVVHASLVRDPHADAHPS